MPRTKQDALLTSLIFARRCCDVLLVGILPSQRNFMHGMPGGKKLCQIDAPSAPAHLIATIPLCSAFFLLPRGLTVPTDLRLSNCALLAVIRMRWEELRASTAHRCVVRDATKGFEAAAASQAHFFASILRA